MKMPRLFTVLATLLTVVSFSALAAPPEVPAGERCSPTTLQGSYLYTIQGYRDAKPYASSGILSFDGAGNAAVLWTSSVERAQRFTTGTYTLNDNCSGSMTR
jgi:hypothetical protein